MSECNKKNLLVFIPTPGISSNIFGVILIKLYCFSEIYLNAIHKDDRRLENEICLQFRNTHKECNSTFRILNKKTNEYRWMLNKRNVIYLHDNTISYVFTLQDVNENKLLEIQLRNQTLRAEEAYNHKSIFLANMSHEIRTPLNGVIGMLTLLEDTKLSTDQQDYINMVKECSFNLMTIINSLNLHRFTNELPIFFYIFGHIVRP